jgi:hypothetical protein
MVHLPPEINVKPSKKLNGLTVPDPPEVISDLQKWF